MQYFTEIQTNWPSLQSQWGFSLRNELPVESASQLTAKYRMVQEMFLLEINGQKKQSRKELFTTHKNVNNDWKFKLTFLALESTLPLSVLVIS